MWEIGYNSPLRRSTFALQHQSPHLTVWTPRLGLKCKHLIWQNWSKALKHVRTDGIWVELEPVIQALSRDLQKKQRNDNRDYNKTSHTEKCWNREGEEYEEKENETRYEKRNETSYETEIKTDDK
jgi:hypothetical protein